MLKTCVSVRDYARSAYHLGEGRVLKTGLQVAHGLALAYHLGEGRVLKTNRCRYSQDFERITLGKGACSRPLYVSPLLAC